jgi:hypothetical protein
VKGGAENRKKTIMAGALGAVALCCVIYGYNALYGGSSPAPAPAAVPVTTRTVASAPSAVPGANTAKASQTQTANTPSGLGVAPGVAATKMASTSSSLDPTLDETAMLRTESLVYTGNGRNIFSAIYTPPVEIPTNVPSARPNIQAPTGPVEPTGPPPPPPINLRFFGTALRSNGVTQAFLLNGEDVYLASVGDIVARKYKIVSIGTSSIQVEDLQNDNTQTLLLVH